MHHPIIHKRGSSTRIPLLSLALMAGLTGCSSAEEYRSRTGTETAKAVESEKEERSAAAQGLPNGLGRRAKPKAYSQEVNGVFLGVDASQAGLRLESRDVFLPVAIVLANSGKKDLSVSLPSFSFRDGETGEWAALPDYALARGKYLDSSMIRQQLGEYDPFTQRFQAMRRERFVPFPSNDPDSPSQIRIDRSPLSTQNYIYTLIYIPNPGPAGAVRGQYLRYADSEANVEVITGFLLREPKR